MKSILLFFLFLSSAYCVIQSPTSQILMVRFDSGDCKVGTESGFEIRDPCTIFGYTMVNSTGIYENSGEDKDIFYCPKDPYMGNAVHIGNIGKCEKLDRDYPESVKYLVYDPRIHFYIYSLPALKRTYHANSMCDDKNKYVSIIPVYRFYRDSDGYNRFTVSSSKNGSMQEKCQKNDEKYVTSCEEQDFYPFAKCLQINGFFVSNELQ